MRRFSSEGNLLDLDFLPWKKVELKDASYENDGDSGTYTPQPEDDDTEEKCTSLPLIILEPGVSPTKAELAREHSISAENLSELNKLENQLLGVGILSDSCRAYSDGQLAPQSKGSTDSVASDDTQTPRSPTTGPLTLKYHPRYRTKAKLSAAKLHLKSLFGQSPHSSTSNLTNADQRENTEQKDSAKERRSRLKFMRQWSQVGHGKSKFSRKELESWATSLNSLLASQTGVSVFGAFLRSEFSEENLQFYRACEQYEQSSHNFSLQRRARDICATYIEPGSPREVNLDSKTRDLTIQLLQAPSHTSLSLAKKRIYSLLDTDCYPRFLQSTVYLSLLSDAD